MYLLFIRCVSFSGSPFCNFDQKTSSNNVAKKKTTDFVSVNMKGLHGLGPCYFSCVFSLCVTQLKWKGHLGENLLQTDFSVRY